MATTEINRFLKQRDRDPPERDVSLCRRDGRAQQSRALIALRDQAITRLNVHIAKYTHEIAMLKR